MAYIRVRLPSDERSLDTISWRPGKRIKVLVEAAALIKGWPVNRLLDECVEMFATEIVEDAARALGWVRREHRRQRSQKAARTRAKAKA